MPFLLTLVFLLLPTQLLANDDLKVVTSIRPLQLITDEIMAGAGKSELLIQSDQSPHHFQLKPSQLKIATKADLVIWVSNEFETGLNRLQIILPADTEQLELVTVLPQCNLIGDDHDIDGHIWLSPENVLLIAQLISQKISRLDPINDQLYLNNMLKLTAKVLKWKQQSQKIMREIQPRYILDHQFLAYFEKSFGLQNIGSLRNNHDQAGSIKQLTKLHQQLQQTAAKCLLVQTLPLSPRVKQISQNHQLQVEVVDLLDKDENHESILDLLDPVIKILANCQ